MILQGTMIAFVRATMAPAPSATVTVSALGGRGSDRRFFRVTWGEDQSSILIHYDTVRKENAIYADIAAFLDGIGIPVPRFQGHDPEARLMLMEDLGDEDLWSLRSLDRKKRLTLYRQTLTAAQRLHAFPVKDFPRDRIGLMEGFGPSLYRWERDYFREHFVKALCGIAIPPALEKALEEELASLADRLHSTAPSLLHRDLQSQNVMVRKGRTFLIDFQGMRLGNAFYDIASLLNDPYVDLPADEVEELLDFHQSSVVGGPGRSDFRRAFWEASAQRLMQALGAYGFLGLTKGLTTFLDHIPTALARLSRSAAEAQSLPRLQELLHRCRRSLEQRT